MLCGSEDGHYNITSNGVLITEGGEFDWTETELFLFHIFHFVLIHQFIYPKT